MSLCARACAFLRRPPTMRSTRACLRNTQRCPRTADRALCDARRRARRERRGEQARQRRRSLRMRLTAHERWRSVRRRPRRASAAAQRQPRTSHQALSPLLNVARICCTGCGRLVSTLTALRAVPSARARAYTDTHRRAKSRSAMRLSATEYSHGYSEYSHGVLCQNAYTDAHVFRTAHSLHLNVGALSDCRSFCALGALPWQLQDLSNFDSDGQSAWAASCAATPGPAPQSHRVCV